MLFRRLMVLAVIATILLVTTVAQAFDGNRKGFIIGFGVGPGYTSFTQTVKNVTTGFDETSDTENSFSFATDFKIGGGITDQFLLYYVNRVTWFGMENALNENVTIANGVGGVGVSYYLETTAPAFYFLGSIGLSTWMTPFEDESSNWVGFGVSGGVGYEFAAHWGVEATVNYGNPKDEETVMNNKIEASTSALAFVVTVYGLAY